MKAANPAKPENGEIDMIELKFELLTKGLIIHLRKDSKKLISLKI